MLFLFLETCATMDDTRDAVIVFTLLIMCCLFPGLVRQVFSTLYSTNEPVLLCLPPTSGKEICIEFAILRMLKTEPASAWKAVYLAPYSSVVQETLRQWSSKLGSGLGLKISELTGDLHADLKVLSPFELFRASVNAACQYILLQVWCFESAAGHSNVQRLPFRLLFQPLLFSLFCCLAPFICCGNDCCC